jgi:hypothetical protein
VQTLRPEFESECAFVSIEPSQMASEMLLETHMALAPSLQCALRLSHSSIVTALFDECGVPADVCGSGCCSQFFFAVLKYDEWFIVVSCWQSNNVQAFLGTRVTSNTYMKQQPI